MPNFNGLVECTSVTSTGDKNTPYYLRADANGGLNVSTIATNLIIGGDASGVQFISSLNYAVLLENHTGMQFTDICGQVSQYFGPVGQLSTINTGVSVSPDVIGLATSTSYGSLAAREIVFAGGVAGSNYGPFANISSDATGSNLSINASTITMSTIANYTVATNYQTGQAGTQTTRPLLVDTTNNRIVKPNFPLFRLFDVSTPDSTGQPVPILDAQGNPYNANQWQCMVVGFFNGALATPGSADRTYGATCYWSANRNWLVEYDQAGTNGSGTILAIHNSLFVDAAD